MTVVLQHRFWDLIVSDDRFEVKLTFDGIPERLVIPYRAIKVFIDPSVRFGLQFDESNSDRETPAPRHTMTMDAAFDQVGEAHSDTPRQALSKKPRPIKKPKSDRDNAEASTPKPAVPSASQGRGQGQDQALTPAPPKLVESGEKDARTDGSTPAESGAKIVSLDQFRKK